MKERVAVIGGGFSGLISAYYLAKKGFTVDLYEASGHLGGLVGTVKSQEGFVEKAARGIMVTKRVEDLISDLGLEVEELLPESKKKFIFRDGAKSWPLKLGETLRLFIKIPRFLFRKSRFAPDKNESIQSWVERAFTPELLRYLVDPALQGIYSGDPARLSARLIVGPFFRKKSERPARAETLKGTVSPYGGMIELIEKLELKLKSLGVRIHLNSKVLAKDLEHSIKVICVSGKEAPEQLQELVQTEGEKNFLEKLRKLEALPLATVSFFGPKEAGALKGLGCLFCEDQKLSSLGVIFNSYMFSGRAREYGETWMLGGARFPEVLSKSEDELVEMALKDREKVFGERRNDLSLSVVQVWPDVMPHYTVDWAEILDQVQLPEKVYLCGNYLGGIGLSKILEYSFNLVERIADKEGHN